MFNELDSVVITRDIIEKGIISGDVGVIVHLYNNNQQVEVEFVSGEGRTLAVETLPVSDIRTLAPKEILHVRSLDIA